MLEFIDGRAQKTPVHVARPKPVGRDDPQQQVSEIVEDVRLRGDEAVLEHALRLDGARLDASSLRVDPSDLARATALVPPDVVDALEVMAERLRRTCERQLPEQWIDETPDEFVGELVRPLRRVGIYAPGGRAAYPSSVIMAAVPAQVAGVEGISVCTPPHASGEVADAVLAACAVVGITEVYRAGGAQAIAALAYGTRTIRPVDKIVGPGNIYVTLAKRLVRGWAGTDTDAGPTEIAVVAGGDTPPVVVAADLIAQAEHGPLGVHALITWEPGLVDAVVAALELEVARHARPDDVENALIEGGRAVLVRDVGQALETVNALAPEHVQLMYRGARDDLDRITNAGSVFVGGYSAVPIGDYVGGTNHVLPSGGTARWASGLSVRDFVKTIYVSGYEETALRRLADHVGALARVERLEGHYRAVQVRLSEGGAVR